MRVLTLSLCLVAAPFLASCEDDVNQSQSCSSDKDCEKLAADLVDVDAAPGTGAVCCNKLCYLPAGGCESGYRNLTSKPSYGLCAANPMCPAAPLDMSVGGGGDGGP